MLKGIERDNKFLELVREGLYTVSKEGVFRSKFRTIGNMKVAHVIIGKDRQYFSITRNRAIWLVYNGPVPAVEGDEYFVTLKDKDKPLHLDNLQLKLRSQLSSEAGKVAVKRLNPKASAKMTDEQVLELRREFILNPKAFTIRQKAKQLNISHATLSFALSGKTYAHVPEPVNKELMYKPGGNSKPRLWDKDKRPRAPRPKIVREPKPRIVKEKVKVEKTNVVSFKPKPSPKPLAIDQQKAYQQKADRLALMKKIGNRLNNFKN